LVDHTHAAATKLLDDSVMRDGFGRSFLDAWLSGRFILKTRHPPVNESYRTQGTSLNGLTRE
ncbi:MAG: hypothetical protein ACLQDM_12860, partial [Bradyrhizobium sp.]